MKLNDFDSEELLFAKMVNEHSHEIHKKALDNSLAQKPVQYGEKKKVSSNKWRDAIITLAIISVVLGTSVKVVGALTGNETIVNSKSTPFSTVDSDISDDIDKKISEYYKMMNMYAPRDTQIEVFEGHDYNDTHNPKVSYDDYNLYKNIVNASEEYNPLTEVKCALYAACKIIREQYREEKFDILFNKLKSDDAFINNTGYDMNKDNIWQMLGYKDLNDFYKNVVKDMKRSELFDKRSSNGKGM